MAKDGLECPTCGTPMYFRGTRFWYCKDCKKLFRAEYELKSLTEVPNEGNLP